MVIIGGGGGGVFLQMGRHPCLEAFVYHLNLGPGKTIMGGEEDAAAPTVGFMAGPARGSKRWNGLLHRQHPLMPDLVVNYLDSRRYIFF